VGGGGGSAHFSRGKRAEIHEETRILKLLIILGLPTLALFVILYAHDNIQNVSDFLLKHAHNTQANLVHTTRT